METLVAYPLECPVRDYDWGNPRGGLIRDMLAFQGRPVPSGTPVAELWMGAHPSAPSLVLPGRQSLGEMIAEDPGHLLGPELAARGVRALPFLFKILEAKRPLSIQAHPDAGLAQLLHARDPEHYPDENHKPELAVSLGGMEALLGFRQTRQIRAALQMYPELRTLCETPEEHMQTPDSFGERDWLQVRFARLMRAVPAAVRDAAETHRIRVRESETNPNFRLFTQLADLFGVEDAGVFCGYFLNQIALPQNRGVFLGPNEPHAYLRGPILECMSSSDNVVRAGLTRKFRDVETLLSMLHYRTDPPTIIAPQPSGPGIEEFPVPVPDFSVRQLFVPGILTLKQHDRPSILVGIGGTRPKDSKGADIVIENGSIFFLPGDLSYRGISPSVAASADTRVYQATVGRSFGE